MGWRSIAVAVIFGMRLFSASSKCDRARTIRALFVGNTFIYVNNVPKLVEGIAAGLPGPCIETGITAIGGATLETRWNGLAAVVAFAAAPLPAPHGKFTIGTTVVYLNDTARREPTLPAGRRLTEWSVQLTRIFSWHAMNPVESSAW